MQIDEIRSSIKTIKTTTFGVFVPKLKKFVKKDYKELLLQK